MKRAFVLVLAFVALSAWVQPAAVAEEKGFMEIRDGAVCLEVENHACVDGSDVFPSQVGKLFCLTRVVGAETPTEIVHVWYFGDIERARIKLAVGSVSFRTFSSKRIQPHEVGKWRVDVLDATDRVLTSIPFEVVP